ncbi:MAG: hypothetical protein QM733_15965 [Ilumatobacteraceae bacterium]
MKARLRRVDPVLVAALAVAALPIVVATVRAVADHWIPIGDNALVAIRARDVLTVNHPLLGTWTSASLDAGVDMNHPGPLAFDALAIPVRLFGGHAGVGIGVMVVNLLAVATMLTVAWRRAGRLGVAVAAVTSTYVSWTMGSELLFDPWNPHLLLLPCLAMLACAWSLGVGGWRALPVYLAVASFCLETHVGYVYVVVGLLAVAVVVGATLHRWMPPADGTTARRLPAARIAVASAATLVVLWAQPLWEQLFGAGEGNLSRLAGATGSDAPKVGGTLAVRILGSVLGLGPWAARAGFADAVPGTPYASPGVLGPVDNLSFGAALVRLAMLVVIVGAASWWVIHRRDRVALAALAVAAGAVLVAFVSLVIMPIGPLGLTPHQMRWLWPIGAFLWFAVLLAVGRGVAERVRNGSLVVVVAGASVAALFAVLALPTYAQPAGPTATAFQIPVVRSLDEQLTLADRGLGAVWFDASNIPIFDNYAAAVLAQLQADGVAFTVDDPGLVRQFGNHRRDHGTVATRLYLLQGREALIVPASSERLALATPLTADEQVQLLADEDVLADFAASGAAILDDVGEAAAAAGTLPVDPSSLADAPSDPRAVVSSGVLPALLRDGFVAAPAEIVDASVRYADLLTKVNAGTTVAVLVSPRSAA